MKLNRTPKLQAQLLKHNTPNDESEIGLSQGELCALRRMKERVARLDAEAKDRICRLCHRTLLDPKKWNFTVSPVCCKSCYCSVYVWGRQPKVGRAES